MTFSHGLQHSARRTAVVGRGEHPVDVTALAVCVAAPCELPAAGAACIDAAAMPVPARRSGPQGRAAPSSACGS